MPTTVNLVPVDPTRRTMEELNILIDEECKENTPIRWMKAMCHYAQPYSPEEDLQKHFHDTGVGTEGQTDEFRHGMVVQTNIPYRALCAHHLFPVMGLAHVGYVPNAKVVGLSKLARLVYGITHRSPSLQEHVGGEIVTALMEYLDAHGAMCIISAQHGCMSCRGIEEPGVDTVTSHVAGVFQRKLDARSEFLQIVQMNTRV